MRVVLEDSVVTAFQANGFTDLPRLIDVEELSELRNIYDQNDMRQRGFTYSSIGR